MTAILWIAVRLRGSVLLSFLSRTIPSSAACSASWVWLTPMFGSVWSFFWIDELESSVVNADLAPKPLARSAWNRYFCSRIRWVEPTSCDACSPPDVTSESAALPGLQQGGALLPFIAHQSVSTNP